MTPLLTEATDWGSHVRLLPHHLVSLGSSVSLAKAVIKGAADYSAVPPGTLTDWLLCHQQHSVVGFLLFNPLLWGGGLCFYIFQHQDVLVPKVLSQCVSVHKGSITFRPQSVKPS